MTHVSHSVLIVGGGIGGLTAAIALGQRGFDVTVIEREAGPSADGVGIKYDGTFKKCTPICHTIRKRIAVAAGNSALPIRRLANGGSRGVREQTAQVIAQLRELRRGHAGQIARARKNAPELVRRQASPSDRAL